jgi:hypothetical protein
MPARPPRRGGPPGAASAPSAAGTCSGRKIERAARTRAVASSTQLSAAPSMSFPYAEGSSGSVDYPRSFTRTAERWVRSALQGSGSRTRAGELLGAIQEPRPPQTRSRGGFLAIPEPENPRILHPCPGVFGDGTAPSPKRLSRRPAAASMRVARARAWSAAAPGPRPNQAREAAQGGRSHTRESISVLPGFPGSSRTRSDSVPIGRDTAHVQPWGPKRTNGQHAVHGNQTIQEGRSA